MKKFFCSVLITTLFFCFTALADDFMIHGFVPYRAYLQDGVVKSGHPSPNYYISLGIHPVAMVYQWRIINKDTLNEIELKRLADYYSSRLKGDIVAIDIESWNNSDPSTLGKIENVINKFKSFNTTNDLGFYGIIPPNTFGMPKNIESYMKTAEMYRNLANKVDYLSPSLYNYQGFNNNAWLEAAEFNMKVSKQIAPQKKIIPYITPSVTVAGKIEFLSYEDMMFRLHTLHNLGANGCIIWTSSEWKDEKGNALVLDPSTPWVKAVGDFKKEYNLK